jgi:hypothetical protein
MSMWVCAVERDEYSISGKPSLVQGDDAWVAVFNAIEAVQ